jgi:hypothetical protein
MSSRYLEEPMSPRHALLTMAVFLLGTLILSTADAGEPVDDATPGIETLFEPYARLLERHLRELETAEGGLVAAFDYRAALDDRATGDLIRQQHAALAAFDIDTLDGRWAATAFWINAYNFFTLAHVLENPRRDGRPVRSVLDFGSIVNRHRVFQRAVFDVGGAKYSLDGIEKGVLLGEPFAERGWKDARVHFAVNCASVGCPPLRRALYTAANTDDLLTENVRRALRTPRHLRVESDQLHLSRLFDWYGADFAAERGSVREFVMAYSAEANRPAIAATRRIVFIDYDWALNESANFDEFDGD